MEDEGVRGIFLAALSAPPENTAKYEPFMLRFMDDVCLRSTLLLLKESWRRHLAEFGLSKDIPAINEILKRFPEVDADDGMVIDFFKIDANEDDITEMIGNHLFDEDEVQTAPAQKLPALDVRSLALRIFHKVWEIAESFFHMPPKLFYDRSKKFFFAKIHLLNTYDSAVSKEIEAMEGFGKEEKLWIAVPHWRKLYIDKVCTYFYGQTEEWRLQVAVNHTYFKNGMRTAMTPPPPPTDVDDIMRLSDSALVKQGSADRTVIGEMERRNAAKEALFLIVCRWSLDVGQIYGH
jgi:hypothetical protein